MERVQINCWVSAEAGARLKLLAASRNQSYGQILTAVLLEQPVVAPDWQIAVDGVSAKLDNTLLLVAALQERVEALEATDRDRVAPEKKAAVIGLESAVEPSSSIPPKALEDSGQNGKGESDTREAIDALVHQHIGIEQLSIQATMKAIRAAGLPVSQGRIAESMKRLGLEPVGGLRQRK